MKKPDTPIANTREWRMYMRQLGRKGSLLLQNVHDDLYRAYRMPDFIRVRFSLSYRTLKTWNELPQKYKDRLPKESEPDVNHYLVLHGDVYNLCDAFAIVRPEARGKMTGFIDLYGDYDAWDAIMPAHGLVISYHPDDAGQVRAGRVL